MKTIHSILIMSLLLVVGSRTVAATPIMIQSESGEEMAELYFLVNNDGTGTVSVHPCPDCASYTLKVTADSKAFRNRKPIPMTSVSAIEKDAAIFYGVNNKTVHRVYLYGNDN